MLPIGPTTTPSWHEEFLLIEKSASFRNLLLPIRMFRPTHNNLIGCYILWFCMFTSLYDAQFAKMAQVHNSFPPLHKIN
jgi:hypothetical protein